MRMCQCVRVAVCVQAQTCINGSLHNLLSVHLLLRCDFALQFSNRQGSFFGISLELHALSRAGL